MTLGGDEPTGVFTFNKGFKVCKKVRNHYLLSFAIICRLFKICLWNLEKKDNFCIFAEE